jgi:hypothetical protein
MKQPWCHHLILGVLNDGHFAAKCLAADSMANQATPDTGRRVCRTGKLGDADPNLGALASRRRVSISIHSPPGRRRSQGCQNQTTIFFDGLTKGIIPHFRVCLKKRKRAGIVAAGILPAV